MKRVFQIAPAIVFLAIPCGCGPFSPFSGFFNQLGSASFIDQGTFQQQGELFGQPCPVWVDTTGLTYHLFQGSKITNAEFDQITTPGTRSRLELHKRDDLQVGCGSGPIVEVDQILEVNP